DVLERLGGRSMAASQERKPMIVQRALQTAVSAALLLVLAFALPARAQQAESYSTEEVVAAGHHFFGKVSGGLATMVEQIVASYGLPNGYIIGEEGSGAIFGGLRYGDGILYT